MSLQDVFYTLGIIVSILNLFFLIGVTVAAWRAYQLYTSTKEKIEHNATLLMAKKIMHNPLKLSSGYLAMQLVGRLLRKV